MKALLLASAILVATTAASSAQYTPRIDQREANQQARINQGIRSGELNRREAIQLQRGQNRIHRMEHRAKHDGVVTPRERARINHAQNVQSRRIWNKKHNWR